MFDLTAEYNISIPLAAGITTVPVRFPQDEEIAARNRRRKVIINNMGRGASETVVRGQEEADLDLYEKIRLDGGPDLTASEASFLLDALLRFQVQDVTLSGSDAIVEAETLTGPVKITIKQPALDSVTAFRRRAYRVFDMPFGKQELRIDVDAGRELYDQHFVSAEGYAGNAVPVVHKDTAIRAVIDSVERSVDGSANFR